MCYSNIRCTIEVSYDERQQKVRSSQRTGNKTKEHRLTTKGLTTSLFFFFFQIRWNVKHHLWQKQRYQKLRKLARWSNKSLLFILWNIISAEVLMPAWMRKRCLHGRKTTNVQYTGTGRRKTPAVPKPLSLNESNLESPTRWEDENVKDRKEAKKNSNGMTETIWLKKKTTTNLVLLKRHGMSLLHSTDWNADVHFYSLRISI